jgi:hypothetical protein
MAVELRNRLERALGVRVPVVELLKGSTTAELATRVADGFTRSALSAPAPIPRRIDSRTLLARLDELSDEEVEALLNAQAGGAARSVERPE